MRSVARRTTVMLAGALTLCTTMISARGTGLDGEVDGVVAAASVEASATTDVVGGQTFTMYWVVLGVCGSCLLMIAAGTAPPGAIVPCAYFCSLGLG
jgi:F0F1-type ATP synthase membrane subunit c/vacuolar-type H+-ATPase subunit K